MIGLSQLKADAFTVLNVRTGLCVTLEGGLRRIRLLGQLFALLSGEVEGLECLSFVDVPMEQFLILLLVLVWHANLARHLGVTEELLGDRRVVHVALLSN